MHRDVKPENLLVTAPGGERDFVKVVDFGIAREAAAGDPTLTATGTVVGTPAYTSPEAARSGEADPRSDVYALGAVLYFCLCGRPPFEADDPIAVLLAHIQDEPRPPSEWRPSIPDAVDEVVMRCLEKDRARRYASGAELASALEGLSMKLAQTQPDMER